MQRFLLASALLLLGCSPRLDADEVGRALVEGDGYVAGCNLGDRWDEVKARRDPTLWPIVEETSGTYRLRREVGSGSGYRLDLALDEQRAVTSLVAVAYGQGSNRAAVLAVVQRAKAKWNELWGEPTCDGHHCTWFDDGRRQRPEVEWRSSVDAAEVTLRLLPPSGTRLPPSDYYE